MNFFKSRLFLTIVGVLLLSILFWLLGDIFGIPPEIRMAAIIVLLVICLVVMAYSISKANRFSSAIEESMKMQAEQQMMGVRPDRREKIEELHQKLEDAIDFLKRSKLGDGRRSKAALYALPWYVFIGPPASGKTTALENSGLNILEGLERIRGVGGTRNCDWVFSDSAIFLDTAGRYVTEHEDRDEWLSFLDTLKKNRPEMPINGVLVGISLTDLVGKSVDEIEYHAGKIRRRIDELVTQLEIQFPVYIVFTKCDLVKGFVEFFGDLDSHEREQIWGCTFDKSDTDGVDIANIFNQEFDLLVDNLLSRRVENLSRARKREERHNIYVFPLEFAEIKKNLSRFVTSAFKPNPYQETPIFRGFYFTSGTQEGVPIDQVIRKVAASFGLNTSHVGSGQPVQTEKKTYFIKSLFTDVVIPDQYLVSQTARSRFKGVIKKAALSTGAAVALGLFIVFTSLAFVRGKQNLNRARTVMASTANVDWSQPQNLGENLSSMISLSRELSALQRWDKALFVGLDPSGRLEEPAEALYTTKVRHFVQAYSYGPLTDRISRLSGNARLDAAQKEQLYEDIKTVLLLSSEAARLEEDEYQSYLVGRLKSLSEQELQRMLAAGGTLDLRNQAEQQYGRFVAALSENPSLALPEPDPRVLRRARLLVSEVQGAATVYNRIVFAEEAQQLPPVALSDLVDATYSHMFRPAPEVPGVYTQRGWQTVVQDQIERESEDPNREEWVLGDAGNAGRFTASTEDLKKELERLYFENYERAWLRFLQSVRYTPAGNLQAAATRLADLSDTYTSPLVLILARATEETTFEAGGQQQALEALEGARGRAADRAADVAGNFINDDPHPLSVRFKWLHDLQAVQGVPSGPLVNVFNELNELSLRLESISQDRALAADYTRTALIQGGGELNAAISNVNRLRSLLRDQMRRQLLEEPIDEIWTLLLRQTRLHLNDVWNREVYSVYESRLAGRFPFESESQEDADLNDVNDFFHPAEGLLAQFEETYLREYENRQWRNRGVRVSENVRQMFDQAADIADHLFIGDEIGLEFQLQPDQTDMLSTSTLRPTLVRLEVHGQTNEYNQGGIRPWQRFIWPGFPNEARVSVTTQRGNVLARSESREWAWLRLLDDADVTPRSPGEFRVTWSVDNQYLVKYNLQYGNKADLYRDVGRFFRFSCPPSLF